MLLHKRLIHQGTVFFRYRGQLPIIVILFSVFLIVFFPINLTKEFKYVFYALSFMFVISGHIIRASTVGNRHKHTSGRNRSHHYAENLNTTGWYSVTRNPLYFANFLIWLGLSLSTQHVGVVLLVCSFFWFVYQRIILSEEDYLLTKFGASYEDWASTTPVFFPSLKKFNKNPNSLSFKTIVKNEYPGLSATLSCMLIINIGQSIDNNNGYVFSYLDLLFLVCILFFAGSMKLLKHKTSFFNSED